MPFGLSNASASFKGYINKILAKKLGIFVIVYWDDILINTKDLSKLQVEVVCWVLDQLQKHSFFTNLKKCRFHQDKDRFLVFVLPAIEIKMEEERIEVVKTWLKLESVRDIQVVLRFLNFDLRFIKNFSRIAATPICILKIKASIEGLLTANNKGRAGNEVIFGVKTLSKAKKLENSMKSKKSAKSQIWQRPRILTKRLRSKS